MRRLALIVVLISPVVTAAQTTGTLTLLPPSGGGGGGDITAVGDCSTGDCFQATTDATFLGAPVGGGVATFRAITESDLPATLATDLELTAAVSAHAGDADAHHVWPLAISDLSDVSETGAAAGEALVADGSGAWAASLATVCLSDGTNCPPGGVGSASPGELLYSSSGAVDGVTGSSVSGGAVTLSAAGSPLIVGATGEVFRVRSASGGVNPGVLLTGSSSGVDLEMFDSSGSSGFRRLIQRFDAGSFDAKWSLNVLNDAGSAWTALDFFVAELDSDPKIRSTAPFRGPAGSASVPSHSFTTDSDSGLYSAGANDVGLAAGGVRGLGQTATETTLYVEQVNSSFSQTCASDGTGAAGFLAVTVSGRSFVKVTNSDPHSCSASLSETGATDGQRLEVVLMSNAGGTLDFADSSGVQETGIGCSLAQWGSATFRYVTDRWALVSCVPTN